MIKCPRCGFEQPADAYCAHCGVHMDTYRSKHRPSLLKSILTDSRLQVSILVAIAIGTFVFLYQKQHKQIESRIRILQGSLQIATSENQLPSLQSQTENSDDLETSTNSELGSDNSKDSTSAAAFVSETEKGLPNTAVPTNKADSKKESSAANATTNAEEQRLHIIYAEVPRAVLEEIFEESQTAGQFVEFEDYQAGIMSTLERRIKNKDFKILHEETQNFQTSQPIRIVTGLQDATNAAISLGLESYLELQLGELNTWRGNFELHRNWQEDSSSGTEITKKTYPAVFELGPKSVFFLSGFLPRRSNSTVEDRLSTLPAFKILKSQAFVQGRSDFVILYEVLR